LVSSPAHHQERDRATLKLSTQDSAEVLSDVLPGLEQAGPRPMHLLVRDPSMDDVFLALTGHKPESPPGTGGGRSPDVHDHS